MANNNQKIIKKLRENLIALISVLIAVSALVYSHLAVGSNGV